MKQLLMEGEMPFLPPEIITNVVKRLPVKSLIRFQCVCKLWKNIIKTPSFISDHLNNSIAQYPSLIFQGYEEKHGTLSLYFLDHEMNVCEVQNIPKIESFSYAGNSIVSSNNGLLCVEIRTYDIRSPPSLVLWNPAIREVKHVPPRIINNYIGDCYLGFGFCSIVNDYKIVRLYAFYDVWVSRVDVYSLRTGSWKEIDFGDDLDGLQIRSETVTLDGVIFWSAIEPGRKEEGEDDTELIVFDIDMVVSFDLATEEFAYMQKPAIYDSSTKLTLYENKLAIISHTTIGKRESSLIELWVMEEAPAEYEDRWIWIKLHVISTSSSIGMLCPYGIWRNDIVYNVDELIPRFNDETEFAENIGSVTGLSLGNLSTYKLKKFIVPRCGDNYSCIFNHVESLVPVANIHIE